MPLNRLWLAFGVMASRGAAENATAPLPPRARADRFTAANAADRTQVRLSYLVAARFTRYLRDRLHNARSAVPMRPTTVEDLMAADSTLPRAVAEWQIARFQSVSRPFNDFSNEFAGITSFRALQELTPAEGAARWLEANDPSARLR